MSTQSFSRPQPQSAVFKFLGAEQYVFDQGSIAAGSQANGSSAFDVGVVLGRITSSGLYVQLNPAATDGSQNFAGIVARRVLVDTAHDTPAAIAKRGPMRVVANSLVWPSGISDDAKATALAQAEAVGIAATPLA